MEKYKVLSPQQAVRALLLQLGISSARRGWRTLVYLLERMAVDGLDYPAARGESVALYGIRGWNAAPRRVDCLRKQDPPFYRRVLFPTPVSAGARESLEAMVRWLNRLQAAEWGTGGAAPGLIPWQSKKSPFAAVILWQNAKADPEVIDLESIWSKTADLPARAPLPGDLDAEAVVIGGGMAGILTAYLLGEKGVEAVVLEAARVGSGQTKNTTAKITSQHALIYTNLIQQHGEAAARQYAHANQRAIEEYRRIIRAEGIDCGLEERPAYLYSTVTDEAVRREAHAARSLGIEAEFADHTALPFDVKGAVRFEGQAQFHPLRFLKAVADQVAVYEDTRVLEVKGGKLSTNRGTVRARHVVFATHYPFVNAPGYYFMRQHQERSYVLALEGAAQLDGMYLGTDNDALSLRNSGPYLLLGGGSHRTGENRAGGRYEQLRRAARQYWPQSREAAHWSAQDCMSMDGIPYIGLYSPSEPRWYVATGFHKWGMTSSMVSAMVLSELIRGRHDPDGEIFSPQRFDLPASAKNLWEDGKQAVKGLSRQVFTPPRAALDELPPGHGGVVECGGEKAGVYKDEDGEVYVVSTRCPHLGCQLEWNPDEKSWDCPCHGSRFDYRGNLIDNPAQENLDGK